MPKTILYCRICDASFGAIGRLPAKCPTCKRTTKWATSPPSAVVQTLTFTVQDHAFLKELRIGRE